MRPLILDLFTRAPYNGPLVLQVGGGGFACEETSFHFVRAGGGRAELCCLSMSLFLLLLLLLLPALRPCEKQRFSFRELISNCSPKRVLIGNFQIV